MHALEWRAARCPCPKSSPTHVVLSTPSHFASSRYILPPAQWTLVSLCVAPNSYPVGDESKPPSWLPENVEVGRGVGRRLIVSESAVPLPSPVSDFHCWVFGLTFLTVREHSCAPGRGTSAQACSRAEEVHRHRTEPSNRAALRKSANRNCQAWAHEVELDLTVKV